MAAPTREALATWARNYVELWNAGKKQAWVENWKKVAPGGFTMVSVRAKEVASCHAKESWRNCDLGCRRTQVTVCRSVKYPDSAAWERRCLSRISGSPG